MNRSSAAHGGLRSQASEGEQDEPADALGRAQPGLERDAPAHAVPDQMDALELERVEQGLHTAREEARVVGGRDRLVRVAEAEQVDRDDPVVGGQGGDVGRNDAFVAPRPCSRTTGSPPPASIAEIAPIRVRTVWKRSPPGPRACDVAASSPTPRCRSWRIFRRPDRGLHPAAEVGRYRSPRGGVGAQTRVGPPPRVGGHEPQGRALQQRVDVLSPGAVQAHAGTLALRRKHRSVVASGEVGERRRDVGHLPGVPVRERPRTYIAGAPA